MKTLIFGGRVIDPANRVDAQLNILMENGKIAWVGRSMPEADEKIDATGKIVCPGFIDIHMHEDPVGEDGKIRFGIFRNMLAMGVTTAVGGQCGISVYDPLEYLDIVDRDGAPVNIAMLAGHEYFRKASGASDKYAKATEEQRTALVAGIACLILSLGAWILIRKMIHPVEEAFRKQQQFVWDASHELKTPLAVISANAEVLEQEIGENEYLGYIRSEVKRTDTLVRNLLTLARLDRNETTAEMKPFDLSHALLDVTLPFESTVFEAGKTLDIQIPEGIEYTGNEEMIKQLAVILLSNALKYSDPNGRIVISLKAIGRQREISVFNTGEAIDPEDRERIFDRFWRADPAHGRETGGHGLGLAIARSIVDTHEGKITVDSREGEGNTFTVLL